MTPEIKQLMEKFDTMSGKLDTHIIQHEIDTKKIENKFDPESDHYILRDVLPILEAYKGSKVLGELLKWLAGIFVAYMVLRNNFHI